MTHQPRTSIEAAWRKAWMAAAVFLLLVGAIVLPLMGYAAGTRSVTSTQRAQAHRSDCITSIRTQLLGAQARLDRANATLASTSSQVEVKVVEALGALALVDKANPETTTAFDQRVSDALLVAQSVPPRQADVDRLVLDLDAALSRSDRTDSICPPVK